MNGSRVSPRGSSPTPKRCASETNGSPPARSALEAGHLFKGKRVRPKSVITAEQFYLGGTALLLVSSLMVWPQLVQAYGAGLAGGVTAFTVGAFLLLILFTTRRGSRVARGLLIVLTGLGAISLLYQIGTGQVALGPLGVVNVVQVVLTVIGAVLLFRPTARAFFARPHQNWEEDAVVTETDS